MINGYAISAIASLLFASLAYLVCLDVHFKNVKLSWVIFLCLCVDVLIFFSHFDSMEIYYCHISIILLQIYLIQYIKIPQSNLLTVILSFAIIVNMVVLISLDEGSYRIHDVYEGLMATLTCAELLVLGFMDNGSRIYREIMATDPRFNFKRKNNIANMVVLPC